MAVRCLGPGPEIMTLQTDIDIHQLKRFSKINVTLLNRLVKLKYEL